MERTEMEEVPPLWALFVGAVGVILLLLLVIAGGAALLFASLVLLAVFGWLGVPVVLLMWLAVWRWHMLAEASVARDKRRAVR